MLGLKETLRAMKRSYSLKACAAMTLGLCFHFLGYECARAASITLLAAKDSGLGNEAIPLTIAVGSPASGLVLYVYTKSIKKYGSKCTIRASFILCILVLLLMSMGGGKVPGGPHYYTRGAGKAAIICFYAFREIYVSLLSSQQWAFIAGTLDKSTSSYIVSFSGIVSIASAVGGVSIEQLVAFGGVPYLLTAALLATCASYLCAEVAFNIREQGGNPYADRPERVEEEKRAEEKKAEDQRETDLRRRKGAVKGDKDIAHVQPKDQEVKPNGLGAFWRRRKGGFWSDSWNLIKKHYLLKVLFLEAITHQLCGNMLNLMFHNALRSEVLEDSLRAMLVGRFFATVNIAACTLQCLILPHVLSQSTLPDVLTKIPLLVLAAVSLGVVRPGLITVMLGFGSIKVLEYSIMHSASEMIYMPMGHEVRYLGKELIRFFGHKLGKSGASLVLSAAVAHLEPSLAMQSVWGAALTLCWGGSMAHLAGCLVERDAQEKGKEKEGEKEKERGEKGEKERVEKDKGEKGEKEKGEREHLDPACVKPGLEEDSISPETTAYSLSLSSARDRELSHDSLVSSEEGATDVEPEHIRPHERTYTDRTEHAESRSHSRQHSHEGPSHARQLSQDAASHRQLSQDAASHPRQHSDSHSRQHSHDGHRLSQEGGGNRFSNTMVEGRPSLLEGRSELEDGMNLDGDEPVFLDSEPDDMDNDQDDQDQDNFYADGFGCKSGDSRDSGELGGLDVDMSRDVGSAGDIGADSPGEPRFSRASPQPVMLRVGSTHVSLSTLEDKAEWRRKNRRKNV